MCSGMRLNEPNSAQPSHVRNAAPVSPHPLPSRGRSFTSKSHILSVRVVRTCSVRVRVERFVRMFGSFHTPKGVNEHEHEHHRFTCHRSMYSLTSPFLLRALRASMRSARRRSPIPASAAFASHSLVSSPLSIDQDVQHGLMVRPQLLAARTWCGGEAELKRFGHGVSNICGRSEICEVATNIKDDPPTLR